MWYATLFADKVKRKHKTIVVDFDGTIAVDLYPDIGNPKPGAKKALEAFSAAGYEIVIFSCRLTNGGGDQKTRMEKWLKDHEMPFDRIDDGTKGKPHALWYIDDKAIWYGGKNDWEAISKHILDGGDLCR